MIDQSNSEVNKLTYYERLKICESCDQYISLTKQCKKCLCFMPLKVRFKIFNCPLEKW